MQWLYGVDGGLFTASNRDSINYPANHPIDYRDHAHSGLPMTSGTLWWMDSGRISRIN